jgi:hypothetical protein
VWAACAQLGQANLAGLRGDYERARILSAEVERTALAAGNRSLLNGVQLTRGFAALGAQRTEEAFTEFSRMMDPTDQAYQAPQCVWVADYLAEAAALSGYTDQALAVLGSLEELIGDTTAPGVLRAMALARATLADDDGAQQRFGEARELVPAARPWYQARLELAHGTWLRRQHRVRESRGPLSLAHAVFDAVGAAAWAARASQELAAFGQRAERDTPETIALLVLRVANGTFSGLHLSRHWS